MKWNHEEGMAQYKYYIKQNTSNCSNKLTCSHFKNKCIMLQRSSDWKHKLNTCATWYKLANFNRKPRTSMKTVFLGWFKIYVGLFHFFAVFFFDFRESLPFSAHYTTIQISQHLFGLLEEIYTIVKDFQCTIYKYPRKPKLWRSMCIKILGKFLKFPETLANLIHDCWIMVTYELIKSRLYSMVDDGTCTSTCILFFQTSWIVIVRQREKKHTRAKWNSH